MTETGHVILIIALALAIYTVIAATAGARAGAGGLVRSARGSILGVAGLLTLALALILYAFFTKDFSFKIVAEHSSRELSPVYALSALYADKAGSLFVWGWLIALFTALLVLPKRNAGQPGMPYAIGLVAVIEAFFISLTTFGGNIFARQPSPPPDGFGLNPLLQNFGMLLHPPLLYLGFAGFAIVFALVMARLITHSPGIWQDSLIRRWSILAWCALGIGNVIGMWWSYNELGWGGYWAWDPVENAGLMPWLLGTAFLHSLATGRQRDYLKLWGLGLIIFTFVFTLLSPFITHGGIESPLHGFYGSPFPPYLLAAMLVVIIGSLGLLYARRRDIKGRGKPASWISREGSLLLTNLILVLLVLVILAGTVLPRVVEALGGGHIVLDRSFFDRSCGPVMLLLVLLMGACPLLGWGKSVWKSARRNVLYFLLAVAVVSAAILISGIGNWYITAVILGGLPLFIIIREWYRGTAARHHSEGKNYPRAFFSFINSNRARYGGFLAHIGIVLIALGIIVSSFYGVERTATLQIGESMAAGKYTLAYNGLIFKQDDVKVSAVAEVLASQNGRPVGAMHPSYDYWFSYDDFFAEVAVRTTAAEDLFVSLVWTGFKPGDNTATFRVLVNPLIVWIWVGGGLFLLGGAVSFSFEEKRSRGGEK
jgi:cytochrome c-type biogenesis protein CcmF